MKKRSYKKGQHKLRDDIYGLTIMSGDASKTWRNLLVDKAFFDEKHPQLIINPRQDKISIVNGRPTPEDDESLPFGEGNVDDL